MAVENVARDVLGQKLGKKPENKLAQNSIYF